MALQSLWFTSFQTHLFSSVTSIQCIYVIDKSTEKECKLSGFSTSHRIIRLVSARPKAKTRGRQVKCINNQCEKLCISHWPRTEHASNTSNYSSDKVEASNFAVLSPIFYITLSTRKVWWTKNKLWVAGQLLHHFLPNFLHP